MTVTSVLNVPVGKGCSQVVSLTKRLYTANRDHIQLCVRVNETKRCQFGSVWPLRAGQKPITEIGFRRCLSLFRNGGPRHLRHNNLVNCYGTSTTE